MPLAELIGPINVKRSCKAYVVYSFQSLHFQLFKFTLRVTKLVYATLL